MTVADPTLRLERALLREGASVVIGCDEVGRGAIAGPVAVGISVIELGVRRIPTGLRDSKMLSEPKRVELAPLAAQWSSFSAVGLATADEVDRLGIIAALGIAGRRALEFAAAAGVPVDDAVLILDGKHDWLTSAMPRAPRVQVRVKADRDCASVAAASVIAKVHRDSLMIEADASHPGYGWPGNKGYGSADHYAALDALGPSPLHRRTWLHDRTAPTLFDIA